MFYKLISYKKLINKKC